jgi:branched-chain amino acid transport system permease protein
VSIEFWVIQMLNALSLGALLFLVAAGLSMILGLMRIVNVAHGSFYMLGAYLALEFLRLLKNETAAILLAGLVVCALGALLQRSLIERVAGDNLRQFLLTFGCVLVISDFSIIAWQGAPAILPTPALLQGNAKLAGIDYPIFRLFVIGAGLALALVLDFVQSRTPVGALIRAGADDLEMLSCMGVNVRRLFVAVFAFGAGIAALGGALGCVFLGVYPGVDIEIAMLGFVVVIVGGLGSIRGTLVASLMVGLIDNISKAILPEVSLFSIFLLMVLVLALRPSGLFGRRALS